jgi:thiamine pyrophosphokinase
MEGYGLFRVKIVAPIAFRRLNCQQFRMSAPIVQSQQGVTLVGGAPVGRAILREALAIAPRLVAADSGADRLLRLGHRPEAVIGDLDSISPAGRAALADRLHGIAEQDTTDFDKALRSVVAPFVLALGFAGARMDHGLAAFNTLVRHAQRRCILAGPRDLAFLAPPDLRLRLRPRTRLSLFPMGPVRGESTGLRWPIDGIDFAPGGRIGTSNEVAGPEVRLRFDAPHMLVMLPRPALAAALDALVHAPSHVRGE